MEITLCLIVCNEAKQLAPCIKSFKGLFSKIVIVDTGSTDNTKIVARNLGATVFSYRWQNDFSKARNYALSKVKSDWTLIVDADDRITKKNKEALKNKLGNMKKNTFIISCPYLYSSDDRKLGQQGYRIRFLKTNLGINFIYPVHEQLLVPKNYQENHMKINIPFLHVKNNDDIKKGLDRNCKIMKKYIKKHLKDLRILYYLVHDNYYLGNNKETIKWVHQYMKNNPKDKYQTNKVLTRQAIAYLNLSKPLDAIESLLMAIGATPELIEPYLYLGDIYMSNKRYEEAIQFYKFAKTCSVPKNTHQFFNTAAYTYYADVSLAYSLSKTSEHRKALQHAKRAQKYIPKDKKLNSHIKYLKSKI